MVVDLRSDTVTLPTPAMVEAMTHAPLGDDVLGDDPTVLALEERCAALAGKEAALFVPSGTMANLIGILVSTHPGDEVLLHTDAHPFHYEGAGSAVVGGVQLRTLPGPRGVMDPADVEAAVRPSDPHYPTTALLCVEDTHNRGGGALQPPDNTKRLLEVAAKHGLSTHLDGARLFNAAVASGMSVADRARVRHRVVLLLESARLPGRIRSCVATATGCSAPDGTANSSAARCGSPACSPAPRCTHSTTTSTASPTTTAAHVRWPPASPSGRSRWL